jgi:hypothetical protein
MSPCGGYARLMDALTLFGLFAVLILYALEHRKAGVGAAIVDAALVLLCPPWPLHFE